MTWQKFKQDVGRWIVPGDIVPASQVPFTTIIKLMVRHMPVRAMFWFRLGSWCNQNRIPFMTGIVLRLLYRTHGLEIQVGGDIGGGLYIAHPIGTVIMPQRIGENCSIIHSITIGMRNEYAFPDIGDNVFIGTGARVLGGIKIGDNVSIGANAVVVKDVPANCVAVGVPAKYKSIKRLSTPNATEPQHEASLPDDSKKEQGYVHWSQDKVLETY